VQGRWLRMIPAVAGAVVLAIVLWLIAPCSSGIYAATWTWTAGNEAGPGLIGITLNSDKGTFGSFEVLNDGSITFTSGAPELSGNGVYKGTGATVHLKDQIPCSFTLDNDVTGSSDGRVLHLKGTLTIIGGAFNC
jgi:hypothetical protein